MTARRVRQAAAVVLLAGGLLVMIVGGGAVAARWYNERSWVATSEAEQAARALAAPPPVWIDAGEAHPTPRPAMTPRPPAATPPPRLAESQSQAQSALPTPIFVVGAARAERVTESATPAASEAMTGEAEAPAEVEADTPTPASTPEPRAPAEAVALIDSAFRFLDPPEPGAQASISVVVRNESDLPTGPLRLTLSTRWLAGWRVLAAEPPILEDSLQEETHRAFDFPGLDGASEGALELQLVATDDLVDPPLLRLSLGDGAEIGSAQPQTVAPRPNPGPARTLEIPRIGLRAAVVQTAWEPPAFVVGQLKGTANLSEGNTVLLGHLTGLAGDIFSRLSELEPGDEVIATSRGLEYRFVVSEAMVLPGDDSIPLQPTDEPRLTLLTCTGEWDPIGHDYSHRLWVVAEPVELAEETLKEGKPGPLTRQLGLAPPLTILPPDDLGPSPKEVVTTPEPVEPPTLVEVLAPDDGTRVDARLTVRGRLTDDADPTQPAWLAVRAEIEGSRWYLYGDPLTIDTGGMWSADLELGGTAGIHHTIVVAPVDAATHAQLLRHVRQRPGEPLSLLPDAFESGARVTVERR